MNHFFFNFTPALGHNVAKMQVICITTLHTCIHIFLSPVYVHFREIINVCVHKPTFTVKEL